ncbi:MAG: hypothetical protein A3E07_00500 [Candidatus Wildermuthbacteria bacterium RIFCSPHIGHO2_12_FULL_45_9]|nr:MAG: hypothetical protein A3E07_00500 [Candidatus Wildermuthbacteria bacterium RIFCSPHIGHO2_12_FULL_45_9]
MEIFSIQTSTFVGIAGLLGFVLGILSSIPLIMRRKNTIVTLRADIEQKRIRKSEIEEEQNFALMLIQGLPQTADTKNWWYTFPNNKAEWCIRNALQETDTRAFNRGVNVQNLLPIKDGAIRFDADAQLPEMLHLYFPKMNRMISVRLPARN